MKVISAGLLTVGTVKATLVRRDTSHFVVGRKDAFPKSTTL